MVMATERVKKWEGKEESRDSSKATLSVDRISKLPERLLCHILSFVPTVDAVRMSVLSRRWRRVWYSVPTLRFSDSDGFHCCESFEMFVEHCLMHRSVTSRYISGSEVASFKLEITCSPEADRPEVNRWSKSPIVRNNVRELEICALLDSKNCLIRSICRPSVALNGRSLSVVKLMGVKLEGSCTMKLPSLKSLCLEDVEFGDNVDDTLRNLMIGCPSLEKFVLKVCLASCFSEIKISSSSLKFMEIDTGTKTVDIEALNLRSLVLHSYGCSQKCFSSCTAIRDLSLFGLRSENRKNIEDQISELTCLETLNLSILVALDCIDIVNPTLKCFSLTKYNGAELKVTTETPNLVSFRYEGDWGFSITMTRPNSQLSGSFSFWCSHRKKYNTDTDSWHSKLITFYANISCLWDNLSLCSNEDEAFIIPEKMRRTCRPPWPNLKHLKVRVRFILMKSELRKSLEWLSPSLETLSVEVLRGKRVQIVAI